MSLEIFIVNDLFDFGYDLLNCDRFQLIYEQVFTFEGSC